MSLNIYQLVTDRIIALLESGVIPWKRPWTGVRGGAYSRATGRPYSLLNQIILGKPGEYLTYKQAIEAGGRVRKGEKAKFVVFWKPVKITEVKDGKPMEKMVPMLRYYNVFHIDQCENIKVKYEDALSTPEDPIEAAEATIADYLRRSGVTLEHVKQNRAYYAPDSDRVCLPLREQFPKIAQYYSTAYHELVHSTGHPSRLNRIKAGTHFRDEAYSREELVAELGAAILMNEHGIETESSFRNSAAYIQSWLRALRSDSRMVVLAAGQAEKAVKLIMNMDQMQEAKAA